MRRGSWCQLSAAGRAHTSIIVTVRWLRAHPFVAQVCALVGVQACVGCGVPVSGSHINHLHCIPFSGWGPNEELSGALFDLNLLVAVLNCLARAGVVQVE